MQRIAILVAIVVAICASVTQAVDMDWVTIGDPGNAPDDEVMWVDGTTGYGRVGYEYRIGKCEVTNAQYAELLNAVAAIGDPKGLYSSQMGAGWSDIGGISRAGSGTGVDPWVYASRPNRGNRPVNYVDWYDTLRFANWMHNGQPTGGQDASTTEHGAYNMSLGSSVVREPGARVVLPSEDEWYKAAYYKGGSTSAGYWNYPTASDTAPTSEVPPGNDTTYGSANYHDNDYVDTTYYTTEVGAYNTQDPPVIGDYVSASAYGTFDQGGNVYEWNEALFDGVDRGLRGGTFNYIFGNLHAAARWDYIPTWASFGWGFRVANLCTLRPWGDVNGDGFPDIDDTLITLACFGGDCSECYDGTVATCDITPCAGDGFSDIDDTLATLAAFGGVQDCPDPCD